MLVKDPCALQVFTFLSARATHAPRTIVHGRQRIQLERGQLITGRAAISLGTGLSEKAVRGAINFLEQRAKIVAIKRANKFSLVTVTLPPMTANDRPAEGPAKGPAERPQKGQQDGHNKEVKNRSTAESGVRPLLELYGELFEAKFGRQPVLNFGKDGAILKGLLKALGEDVVRDILHRFFQSADPFIMKSGFSIGILRSQANRFLAEASRESHVPAYEGAGGRRLESLI